LDSLAAMTRSEITIKDVSWDNLGLIPNTFRKLGITIERKGDDIYIPAHENGYEIKTDIDGSI
jgi:UDP-N-acetylglucosamine 1-carboxyvinyltransferase